MQNMARALIFEVGCDSERNQWVACIATCDSSAVVLLMVRKCYSCRANLLFFAHLSVCVFRWWRLVYSSHDFPVHDFIGIKSRS
mmetsp:Transcript_13393/g.22019  ORF Transcript_13393/g.22019 Transcript_13393/m.22019 type:complete len:84 (-) Transcript_13393:45-296(-)